MTQHYARLAVHVMIYCAHEFDFVMPNTMFNQSLVKLNNID